MAVKEKIRIRLQSYDAQLIDAAAEKIVETAKHTGARVSGPIPLPTDREIVTVLRATHKYKDSREQFESRTHKRLIDILKPSRWRGHRDQAVTADPSDAPRFPRGHVGGDVRRQPITFTGGKENG